MISQVGFLNKENFPIKNISLLYNNLLQPACPFKEGKLVYNHLH
jgi:hypothetical protein